MNQLTISTKVNEDGDFEARADGLGVIGAGPTTESAISDLRETITSMWDEFSQTPAARLSDDALELFMNMRRCGVGQKDAP